MEEPVINIDRLTDTLYSHHSSCSLLVGQNLYIRKWSDSPCFQTRAPLGTGLAETLYTFPDKFELMDSHR